MKCKQFQALKKIKEDIVIIGNIGCWYKSDSQLQIN